MLGNNTKIRILEILWFNHRLGIKVKTATWFYLYANTNGTRTLNLGVIGLPKCVWWYLVQSTGRYISCCLNSEITYIFYSFALHLAAYSIAFSNE